MNVQQVSQLHENDRKAHAQRLGLSLSNFDRLVASANHVYEVIKDLGPFYRESKEPTFRISAEPISLPKGSQQKLEQLGNDIIFLAKALKTLPDEYKKLLGDGLNYAVPPTWRVDIILDEKNDMFVNEIEGQDGASALYMATEFAYGLQTLQESTAAKLIPTLKAMCQAKNKKVYTIAHVRVDNPHNVNADKFIEFVDTLSKGTLKMHHLNEHDIMSGRISVDWDRYDGVILEPTFAPEAFFKLGLPKEKLLSNGVYNALVNKGVFALLFEKELSKFWTESLSADRFDRLKKLFIPTSFIRTFDELKAARAVGKVVKVSWAGEKAHLINRSQGVAMPKGDTAHGGEERWKMLEELLTEGLTIIAQDFVMPKRIVTYLRKKSITLEQVEWYNRVCVKYVADDNPNNEVLPTVSLTAACATLGPNIIPAGRECTFVAAKLQ